MSASAYSTHPARLAFGTGFDAYPALGRRRAAREFWQLFQVECWAGPHSERANGPPSLSLQF